MIGKPLKIEFIMCRVLGAGIPSIFICLIYRPPKISFNANPDFLVNLRDLCSSYRHKVIMGDLNENFLTNNSDTLYTIKFVQGIIITDNKS